MTRVTRHTKPYRTLRPSSLSPDPFRVGERPRVEGGHSLPLLTVTGRGEGPKKISSSLFPPSDSSSPSSFFSTSSSLLLPPSSPLPPTCPRLLENQIRSRLVDLGLLLSTENRVLSKGLDSLDPLWGYRIVPVDSPWSGSGPHAPSDPWTTPDHLTHGAGGAGRGKGAKEQVRTVGDWGL